jgi:hypothetical protein
VALQQIARLDRLDPSLLERLCHEVLTVPCEWVSEYGQYQSGGWWTLSLLNDSGVPTDVTIKDCNPIETTLLQRMPVTRSFLSSLGLRYMWVRLARLGRSAVGDMGGLGYRPWTSLLMRSLFSTRVTVPDHDGRMERLTMGPRRLPPPVVAPPAT